MSVEFIGLPEFFERRWQWKRRGSRNSPFQRNSVVATHEGCTRSLSVHHYVVRMFIRGLVMIFYAFFTHIFLVKCELKGKEDISLWHPSMVATIRLMPGDDIKVELLKFTKEQHITSGSIVAAVGSVESIKMRLASASAQIDPEYIDSVGKYEIVSLVGTMEYNEKDGTAYGHFHISIADIHGKVIGGHLMDGCRVYTTVEMVIMQVPNVQNTRVLDATSGYKELKVEVVQAFV